MKAQRNSSEPRKMGNSLSSCLCQNDSPRRSEVVVMKEDGEVIRFIEGTRVQDILSGHPHHKVIKCCSERSVLQNSYQLCCNRLYFLLPKGLAVCDAIYDGLIRAAVSKDLISSKMITEANDKKLALAVEVESCGEGFMVDESENKSSWGWKPALQTIPEGVSPSPPPKANVQLRPRFGKFQILEN